jgi:DNA-binding transcriptional ArsR family regulator
VIFREMSRLGTVLVALVGFATLNTVLAGMHLLTLSGPLAQGVLTSAQVAVTIVGSASPPALFLLLPAVQFLSIHSLVLAPTTWVLVGGVWMWRGRVRSRWEGLGFDSDVFRLFMRMKGGKTRLRMLNALSKPKDRYQLAQELGMDWRAVDQHLVALARHALVSDDKAYGKVRMYQLTPSGKLLLQLLEDIDAEAGKTSSIALNH